MNEFVQFTEQDDCSTTGEFYGPPGIVMDYYDGNTVTGLWNYAQNYAMSDNNWDTTFGPSTEGAIDVSSGLSSDSYAVTPSGTTTTDAGAITSDGTIYGDIDPYYDECSDSNHTSSNPEGVMTGENIGDLLNTKHVTWGWFQGGFAPTSSNSGGAVCGAQSDNIDGSALNEYTPHWNPFQFNATTANPAHLAASSESAIGRTDQANHQYDLSDFSETLKDGNMPSVSYLKATTAQSGHPGESDPLDEQQLASSTRSTRSSSRSTGPRPRSSSPMTTPTAGTTTPAPQAAQRLGQLHDRHGHVRGDRGDASAAPTDAAATASGCRCSSSRRTRGTTTSATTSPTPPRW